MLFQTIQKIRLESLINQIKELIRINNKKPFKIKFKGQKIEYLDIIYDDTNVDFELEPLKAIKLCYEIIYPDKLALTTLLAYLDYNLIPCTKYKEKIGVSRQYLNSLLSGKRPFTERSVINFSEITKIPQRDFKTSILNSIPLTR